MDSLRALQEAGAATKEGQGRPEARWLRKSSPPTAVGPVLLTAPFAVL
ncbi:hypothetical protein [Streptomyces sp. NPDC012616]